MSFASFTFLALRFPFWSFSLAPAHGDIHHQGIRGRLPPRSKNFWFLASPFPLLVPASTRLLLFLSSHSLKSTHDLLLVLHLSRRLQTHLFDVSTADDLHDSNESRSCESASFIPFSSFQIIAAFLLNLFHYGISTNRAFSAQAAEPVLISFLPVLHLVYNLLVLLFRCSALQPDFVFHHVGMICG